MTRALLLTEALPSALLVYPLSASSTWQGMRISVSTDGTSTISASSDGMEPCLRFDRHARVTCRQRRKRLVFCGMHTITSARFRCAEGA